MGKTYTFEINLDAKCVRCGKGGAMKSGICMKCIAKGIQKGEFDHILKPLVDETKRRISEEKPD